jgi:outer membrane protein
MHETPWRNRAWFRTGLGLVLALSAKAADAPDPQPPLTLSAAVLLALERNPELAVERFRPAERDADLTLELAAFDPELRLTAGKQRSEGVRLSAAGQAFDFETDAWVGKATVRERFETGTTVEMSAETDVNDEAGNGRQLLRSRLGASIVQPVLRNAGIKPNLARVRQARMDVLASQYELRGFTEQLVAAVEEAYWDHARALRELAIYEESIASGTTLLASIRGHVEVGALARTSTVAAESELAFRRQDLIDARAAVQKSELRLRGLLDRLDTEEEVRLADELNVPSDGPEEVRSHVAAGLGRRPELNQARLAAERDELEVVRTRNGLLPKLDVFVDLGRSGYADSVRDSWGDLGNRYDFFAGVSFAWSARNLKARAEHASATAVRGSAYEAVRNLERLVQLDVRTAHIEAVRARDRVAAVAATRQLEEQSLHVETEQFFIGRASSSQVMRAQRDLLRVQLDEVEAVADYRKALAELYRLDGSLLERRGIEVGH